MKTKIYKPTKDIPNYLLSFLQNNYGKEENFNLFLNDYVKSYNYCVNNENIVFVPIYILSKNELVSHVALIIDKRLPRHTAFFGFLEVIKDASVLRLLWKKLKEVAKANNVSILKGPINGSIWHQYRCIKESDGSKFFKSEPICKIYYYEFLKSLNPTSEIEYYSARRKRFDNVLPKIEINEDQLTQLGFSIKKLENIDLSLLIKIAILSKNIFSNSWGFTELTKNEFLNLYSSDKIDKNLNKLYVLYKNDEIIGYCSTVKEDNMTIICKTICILPDFQGLGLGNALAYKVHSDLIKEGFKEVIYALIRRDNKIKNFPKIDADIFRRYSAFEFKI